MKTSWRDHRPHAVANLLFRAIATIGFGLGLLYAALRSVPGAPGCDIEKAACMARLVRYEALYHVAPPVIGLIAGAIVGSWIGTAALRHMRRARTA
jgi:hypothetical protein